MKLGYVIIYVPDVPKAVAFYSKAFGMAARFIHKTGGYAELETGGTALAFAQEEFSPTVGLFTKNRPGHQAAGAEIAFVTDNVEAGFNRAIAAGAMAALQPTQKPWGQTVGYVRDLNGFLVEICSPMGG